MKNCRLYFKLFCVFSAILIVISAFSGCQNREDENNSTTNAQITTESESLSTIRASNTTKTTARNIGSKKQKSTKQPKTTEASIETEVVTSKSQSNTTKKAVITTKKHTPSSPALTEKATVTTESPMCADLKIGSAKGEPGQVVRIPIYFENNPGVWGVAFSVDYDSSVLTLEGKEYGNVFSQNEILTSNLSTKPFRFTGESNSLYQNNYNNGVLIYLNFRISKKAASGKYPVSISNFDPDDVFDISFVNKDTNIINGAVTVK